MKIQQDVASKIGPCIPKLLQIKKMKPKYVYMQTSIWILHTKID